MNISDPCEHFSSIRPVTPTTKGCEECLAIGATWTELRICLSCGHVGCCESSEHAHALQHFNVTAHPMIAPLDRRETWGWCYVHRRYFDPMPATVTPRRGALAAFFGRLVNR
jgi:hypothetical protein